MRHSDYGVTESKAGQTPALGLQMCNVTRQFGRTNAVDNISLSVPRGSFVCLVGPSGCGKTTTLRMIAGLEMPSDGSIRLGGKTVTGSDNGASLPPEKRDLGMVFQSYAIWPHMSVQANIEFGLKLRKLPKAKRSKEVVEVLRLVGLDGYGARYPEQLSGGQQQRVAVARAIVTNPSILLFDEPLSNLDEKLRESMRIEIKALQKKLQITSLYVTHSHQEALALGDLIGVMNAGRIVQLASPMELYLRPVNSFVADFVGFANIVHSTVVSISNDSIEVNLVRDHVVELDRRPELEGNNLISKGAEIKVMCRPEMVKIASYYTNDLSSDQIVGEVVSALFSGGFMEYLVDIGDEITLRVHQKTSDGIYDIEDSVSVEFDPKELVVLYE